MSKIYLTTPVGRIVQGHPCEIKPKMYNGVQQMSQSGEPKEEVYFGLAIEKTNPDFPAFWGEIQQKANVDFPQGHAQMPTFKWKLMDGDLPEYSSKEGFAGHYVLKLSSGFAPQLVSSPDCAVMQSSMIKRGDYCRVQVSVEGNGDLTANSGLYINPVLVQHIGYGEEITSGPDPREVFAQGASYVPQGVSQTPVAPTSAPVLPNTPTPQMPAQAPVAQPVAQAPVAQPAMPQQQPVAPAHDFVANAGAVPGMPAQAPAAQPMMQQPGLPGMPPAVPTA